MIDIKRLEKVATTRCQLTQGEARTIARELLALRTAPGGMERAETLCQRLLGAITKDGKPVAWAEDIAQVQRRDAQHILRAKRLEDRIAEAVRELHKARREPMDMSRRSIDAALAALEKP